MRNILTPYSLVFTRDAERDLNGIYDYIAHSLYAEKAARRLMAAIEREIRTLADFPYSAPLVADARFAERGYRKLLVEHYVVVYTVDDDAATGGGTVTIMRVFYAAMDYEHYL